MRRKAMAKLWVCTGGVFLATSAGQVEAQLAVTGNFSTTAVTYGANAPGTGALATQTLNTAFSDNTNSAGATNGSELDASYGVVENGYLYVFLAGNIQNNGNTVQVWIDDGRAGGQNVLNAFSNGTGNMAKMNGSTFSPGFNATYAVELNAFVSPNTSNDGPMFVDQYNLVQNTATYLGSFGLTGGKGASTELGSGESAILVGVNNTNIVGVTASGSKTVAATAANQTNAQAVTTGIELGIPLATLGNPTGPIEVMAGINGSSDSGLSNQMLPGLPVGSYDVKSVPSATLINPYYYAGANGLGFNFSTLSNEFFTVPNTVISNGIWLPTGSGTWDNTTTTNWSNGVIPQAVGDTASFSSATVSATVTLAFSATVGTVNFNDANSYLLAAGAGDTLTLDNGGIGAMAAINDSGGTHTISAPLMLNSNLTVTCQNHGDTMIISGNISGNGELNVSNSGTFNATFSALVLSGANTYSGGTLITRGELQLASAGALPVGTALTIDDPNPHGALDLNGFNATVSSLAATTGGALPAQINNGNPTAGMDSTFTYAGSNAIPSTYPGEFTDSSQTAGGKLSLVVQSGSLTLTGLQQYAGNTTVNSGATLVESGTWSSSVTVGGMTVNSGGTLVLSGTGGSSLPTGHDVQNDGSLAVNDTINAGSINGAGTTTVNATMSLTAINLNQAGGLVNNGTVTVNGSGTVGPISGAGTLTVNGALRLATSSGLSTMGSLSVGGTGTFDVNNNHVIINYGAGPDPVSSIQALLALGYAGASWTGTGGITSTAAAADSTQYGLGFADSADAGNPANLASGTLEIAFTLLGDANLDGVVNGIDFGILAANFNKGVTSWDQGDFDYNGVVNGIDFGSLAANFNKGASGAADQWAAIVSFASANGLLADVPEPASVGVLALAGLGILNGRCLRRRRARRSLAAG